ncbi:hypothetical protein Tco_0199219 [Tanacetum coccineum]
MDEPVFHELVWEFFTSFEFDSVAYRLASTRSGLRRGETVKAEHVLMGFWPTIGDGEFVIGGMAVKKVMDPRIRLAHHWGMFVTRIARSLGLLTNAMVDALSVEPRAHVGEDDEVEEAANEGAGGSADMYLNLTRGYWQVMRKLF